MKPPIALRAAVRQLPRYHAPAEGRNSSLRLDFNENTVGCSPRVCAALARMGRKRVAMYPEYQAVQRRLARFFGVRRGEMLLTNGADDALGLLAAGFLERGRRALVMQPTFPMYRFYATLAGALVESMPYGARMRFPVEAVCKALRRGPRIFFLANPNNPTGTLVSHQDMRQVLEAGERTLVVVDEAYAEFSGVTVLDWIRRYSNLVVTRTFSKAAGLAGLRVGCLFAHARLIAELRRAQAPFAVNAAALVAAEAAAADAAYIRAYVREVRAAREMLQAALARLGIAAYPSGGNFVLAEFGARGGTLLRALRRRGILLRAAGRPWGRPGRVRITVGTRAQMRRLVRVMENCL